MAEFAINFDYPVFTGQNDGYDQIPYPGGGTDTDPKTGMKVERPSDVPLPPIVICPSEVEHISITLEKNQQCACKDCGKLFNSVWYLKQHAVKHSNDRPFKCKFCFKTYKFRSNLYQHKCPDRQKSGLTGRRGARGTGVNMNSPANGGGIMGAGGGIVAAQAARRMETAQLLKNKIEGHMANGSTVEEGSINNCIMPMQPSQHAAAMNSAAGGIGMIANGYSSDADEAEISYGLCIRIEPDSQPLLSDSMPPPQESIRPPDCIRLQPMPYEEVERYVTENKTKIHTCRKCKLHFPSESSLERHTASHNVEENHSYRCDFCPQVFPTQQDLSKHTVTHATMGPWSCDGCTGCFRSSVALRRHVDACRSCRYRPFDMPMGIIETAAAPLDPSSFIISEADLIAPNGYIDTERSEREKAESGIGSSPESSMLHTSPARSATTTIEDEFDENHLFVRKKNKDKEDDDADSGFRSRLNSVTQSCSPGSSSAFSTSSDAGSPHRKNSHDGGAHGGLNFGISSFGSGTSYGQKIFIHEQSVGGTDSFNYANEAPNNSLFSSMPSFPSSEQISTLSISSSFDPLNRIRIKSIPMFEDFICTPTAEDFVGSHREYSHMSRLYSESRDWSPTVPQNTPDTDIAMFLIHLLLRYILHNVLPYCAVVRILTENTPSTGSTQTTREIAGQAESDEGPTVPASRDCTYTVDEKKNQDGTT